MITPAQTQQGADFVDLFPASFVDHVWLAEIFVGFQKDCQIGSHRSDETGNRLLAGKGEMERTNSAKLIKKLCYALS